MVDILIVEDNKELSELLCDFLRMEGYVVSAVDSGEKALAMYERYGAKLLVLDVMLPVMDGFEVLRRLRQTSDVPVIMVTAREEETDKILGLETGADDYITKPFSIKELAARIKANMRRTVVRQSETPKSAPGTYGPFRLDKDLQSVTKNGRTLELTPREYDIICYFFERPAQVISREELMENVWGYDYYGDLLTQRQKECFEMRYYQDLSLGEIGEELGISTRSADKITSFLS